jgi:BolA family transcriptional regulator, general stress-responsive regulator
MMMECLGFNPLEEKNMSEFGPVGLQITQKLKATFAPQALSLIDESNQHHGHSGAHPSGESHFRVKIAAEAFRGKSRVECHRMVNAALAEELKSRVHALAIECAVPTPAPAS